MLECVKDYKISKAGVKFSPAFLIFFYYLIVGLDIYTTYLATPDLNYEANIVIRFFSLNWSQIIILALIGTTFLSLFYFFSFSYLINHYQKSKLINVKKTRIFLGVFFIGCFYSHFFTSIFVVINNYLNYLYLYRPNSALQNLATSYVKLESTFFPLYYLYTRFVTVALGFLFTLIIIKRLRGKWFKPISE